MDSVKILDKNLQFNRFSTGDSGGNHVNTNVYNNNKSFSSPNNYKNYSHNNNTLKKNTYVTSPYKKPPLLLNNMYDQRDINYDDCDTNYHDNNYHNRLRDYDERKRSIEYENIYNDVNNINVNNNVNKNTDVYNNTYDPDDDESVRDFDYSDVRMDNNNDVYSKHDPLNPDSQIVVHNCCYALMSGRVSDPTKTVNLPCFEAMKGRCPNGAKCKFSHNDNILRKEYESQLKDLNNSPYGKNYVNSNVKNNNVNMNSSNNNFAGQCVTPKNILNRNLWNIDDDISYGDYKKLNNMSDSGGCGAGHIKFNNNGDLTGDTGRSMSDVYGPFTSPEHSSQVKALSSLKGNHFVMIPLSLCINLAFIMTCFI